MHSQQPKKGIKGQKVRFCKTDTLKGEFKKHSLKYIQKTKSTQTIGSAFGKRDKKTDETIFELDW